MLSGTLLKALNEQVGRELYSAYLYLSMASYFDAQDLPGFARWMKIQAREELGHAMKIYEYIYERNGRVELPALEKPRCEWESPLKAFEQTVEHERYITKNIYAILELAKAENDHATTNFLQWFVKEQVEEEAQVELIVRKLTKIGDSGLALYMIDKELGSREE